MNEYVVQYITTDRHGNLKDGEVTVFATDTIAAILTAKDMDSRSAGHVAYLAADHTSIEN